MERASRELVKKLNIPVNGKFKKVGGSNFSSVLLITALFTYTLGAYNIGPIPLTWLSTFLFIVSPIPALIFSKAYIPRFIYFIVLYLIVGVFALLFHNIFVTRPPMPPLASTPYLVYAGLRIANVISYISASIAVYTLVLCGFSYRVMRAHILLLSFVTIAGLYIYVAQIYGLWEPFRNRMGTGGQDFASESVEFQYSFHRALGTFREPSHLANWLTVTLLFLLPQRSAFHSRRNKLALLISAIFLVLLTGSLLGVICLLAGSITLLVSGGRRTWVVVACSLFISPIVIWFADDVLGIDFVSAIAPRLEALYQDGLGGTNRSYIYEYFWDHPPTIAGVGIGNGALIHSLKSGNLLISPIINAFLNSWYETGVVGLLLIIIAFMRPLTYWRSIVSSDNQILHGCLAAHICWMFAYFGMLPELSPYHATTIGIFFGQISLKNINKYPR